MARGSGERLRPERARMRERERVEVGAPRALKEDARGLGARASRECASESERGGAASAGRRRSGQTKLRRGLAIAPMDTFASGGGGSAPGARCAERRIQTYFRDGGVEAGSASRLEPRARRREVIVTLFWTSFSAGIAQAISPMSRLVRLCCTLPVSVARPPSQHFHIGGAGQQLEGGLRLHDRWLVLAADRAASQPRPAATVPERPAARIQTRDDPSWRHRTAAAEGGGSVAAGPFNARCSLLVARRS